MRLGCDIRVLTSSYLHLNREEEIDGMKIQRVPALRRYESMTRVPEVFAFIFSGSKKIGEIIKSETPDAILAFLSIPAGVVAYYSMKRWRIPYVVSIRGIDVPGSQPRQYRTWQTLARPVVKRVWKQASMVVANSEGLKRIALGTIPDFPIEVIPNGVDVERFRKKQYNDETEKSVRILFVGRISYEKGLQYLLPALSRLDTTYRLEIVGEGKFRSDIENLSRKLGLSNRVVIRGWVPQSELPVIYRSADIFVLPSTSEGMPNVVLEAMSSGIPVVATRVPGSEELVRDGINGFLVEKEDIDDLFYALNRLIRRPQLRREMGQAGREIALKYQWDNVASSYLKLIGSQKDV